MIIVAQISLPTASLNRAVSVYTGLKVLPVDIKRDGPYFRMDKGRIQAITHYIFKCEVSADPLEYIRERYLTFEGVPGFTCDINRWQSLESVVSRLIS